MHPLCCSSPVPVSPTAPSSDQPPSLDHCSTPTSAATGFRLMPRAPASAFPSLHDAAELRLNDIVGAGIAGILYKWVNYGRGWRPRWFLLLDGVLSYYKIHGPHRIRLEDEADKGSMIIGDDSLRLLNRRRRGQTSLFDSSPQCKPIGELHLKVATVKESKSDDRRFSIFTGTKRLHLRAESGEDRMAWMEALQAVKEMFPRISNSELMVPVDNFVVSTEKLRLRLVEEGVSEAAIQDSEQIVRCEFSGLQRQLASFKQKQCLLIETLRQLETEKVDLENTLVTESQRQSKEHESTSLSRNDKSSETSITESEDDNERQDIEEGTEDEDNAFFDTKDFLSSSSFKSSGSGILRSEIDSDDEEHFGISIIGHDSSESFVGFCYPYVKRRKKLPDPVEKEKGVSLWSMIKDNIGKDLTKVCLPVYFNEPLSSLQRCFEDLEYSYLLDQAYEWGKKGNGLMRILSVAAFAVSGYASTEGRICKPFNPLLGETYEADFPDKGLRFFSEKVSHHPMIVACHCEGTGWRFWADSNLKSKFWGRSIELDPVGLLTLEFDDGEIFQWSKVTTSIYNLILGKLYCDHYGTMRIQGNRDYSCKLKFKEQSIIDRNPHQVRGVVHDLNGKTMATVLGKWDESMHYVLGDPGRKGKGAETLPQAQILWKRSKPPKNSTRYNLTRFGITLNELTPDLKEKLPPTDSRLRPDQRCLENGEFDMANAEKLRLEQRQRQARTMQESGWKPRWFAKDEGHDTYHYIGGYWEAREKGRWDDCPDIFGQVPADPLPD